MREAFALQKLSHIFSTKNIAIFEIFMFALQKLSHIFSTKNFAIFEIFMFEILTTR